MHLKMDRLVVSKFFLLTLSVLGIFCQICNGGGDIPNKKDLIDYHDLQGLSFLRNLAEVNSFDAILNTTLREILEYPAKYNDGLKSLFKEVFQGQESPLYQKYSENIETLRDNIMQMAFSNPENVQKIIASFVGNF